MLDGRAQRFLEGNRRVQMKAIERPLRPFLFSPHDRRPEQLIGKGLAAKIPRAQEVVFASCPIDRWQLFAIHKEHVVSLSPPAVVVLKNRHGYADEMATA